MSETYPAAPLYENLLWHRLFLDPVGIGTATS
jgi:hypothetical protein